MFAFVVISLVLYLLLISNFVRGWRKIPSSDNLFYDEFILKNKLIPSVVICFKNEGKNLPALINALKHQTYTDFELIWVNDHSTDDSVQIVEASLGMFKNAKLFHSLLNGKKQAQSLGIQSATNEFIITTDADCIPESTWIECMVRFQLENQTDLIIAPVKLQTADNVFARLQALEFAILVGSGMGSAGIGKPVFCNAANMAFSKQAWLDSLEDLHPEEPSGDDVFLLHSIKKRQGNIAVLKSDKAMVTTDLQRSFKSFIGQRSRWAAKTSKYRDFDSIFTALTVFSLNIILLILLGVSLLSASYIYILAFVFFFKLLAEISFINNIKDFFKLEKVTFATLILAFCYPWYVIMVMFVALFRKKRW